MDTLPFKEVWAVDFEFGAESGELPEVRCMVAKELRSGRTIRLWVEDLISQSSAPFSVGDDSVLVAYLASAEMGCFLKQGWKLPTHVLDLFAEFRVLTNGKHTGLGASLLDAMSYFGLNPMDVAEKEEMRQLALRGGSYSEEERVALLSYCEQDVLALEKLLPFILPRLDLPRALLRGRYMKAVSVMEFNGIPVDRPLLERLKPHWEEIKEKMIRAVDGNYGVYDGLTFKTDRFEQYLADRGFAWPRSAAGHLDLQDDTFKGMARVHPELESLRQLRATLSGLRLNSIAVGSDARNRCLLSPFRAKTSRNQPSNSKFVFGPSSWFRHMIKPADGMALAYIDWSQQEFGIAAALSGDAKMQDAYRSGDPYLAFAKQAGAAPADATKKSHAEVRDLFKACVLAVQYGMGADSLALRIGKSTLIARNLLRLHRETYHVFWQWSDDVVNHAMLAGILHTTFGWTIHVEHSPEHDLKRGIKNGGVNDRMLRNFPMQANGAEMMRIAASLITEAGIKLCAPVHDALLIEAPIHEIDAVVKETEQLMVTASEIVLGGFKLMSTASVVKYPDRYQPEKKKQMWDLVIRLLEECEANRASYARREEIVCATP